MSIGPLKSFSLRCTFFLLLSAELIQADWTLFVQAGCWNGTELSSDGIFCDLFSVVDDWGCEPQFVFCLREFGTSRSSVDACPLGRVQTGAFPDDSFCFDDAYIDQTNNVPNPITFKNDGSYPGNFQLLVQVEDFDESSASELIADIFINLYLDPSNVFTSVANYGGGDGDFITLQFKVECDINFDGPNCLPSDTTQPSGNEKLTAKLLLVLACAILVVMWPLI